ncbi:MAG TPA: HEAT repeat domain-containing protein, partial [Pirellulaceae bacterium]|nr:HEAT repeat domain-containing protein [Pirellulaceae bacterium]
AVRQRLVEQLATQRVVDGKPWLLRLLEDRDSHVRLAAATILSTSGDPQVVKRLRERALEENDPTVKNLLNR